MQNVNKQLNKIITQLLGHFVTGKIYAGSPVSVYINFETNGDTRSASASASITIGTSILTGEELGFITALNVEDCQEVGVKIIDGKLIIDIAVYDNSSN